MSALTKNDRQVQILVRTLRPPRFRAFIGRFRAFISMLNRALNPNCLMTFLTVPEHL